MPPLSALTHELRNPPMHFRFLDDLNAFLAATYSAPEVKAAADLCPADFAGDVTVSCFPLAKALRRNPMQLAPAVSDFLAKHPDVQQVEAVKAFVNITLTPAALMRDTVAEPQGILPRSRSRPKNAGASSLNSPLLTRTSRNISAMSATTPSAWPRPHPRTRWPRCNPRQFS